MNSRADATQIDMFGGYNEVCVVDKDPIRSGLEEMDDRKHTRYAQRHHALVADIAEIGLPAPGEQYRIITRRTFNSIQLLEYICQRETITDLKLAIYSINYYAAIILADLVTAGKIQQCEILMSNLRNKAHREKEEVIKNLFTDHPRIELFFCSSHAKTFSGKTDQGNYYTCEGSGNMAYNSRVEQYVIDNDQGTYEFTCSWMAEIKTFLAGRKELEIC